MSPISRSTSISSNKIRGKNKTNSSSKSDKTYVSSSSSSSSSSPASSTRKPTKSTDEELRSRKFSYTTASTTDKPKKTYKPRLTAFEAVEQNKLKDLKEVLELTPSEAKQVDKNGKTLLIVACEKGHDEIVKYLAENYEELKAMDNSAGYYPVHVCARYNKVRCLEILYQNGAPLLAKTNNGETPLHIAAFW